MPDTKRPYRKGMTVRLYRRWMFGGVRFDDIAGVDLGPLSVVVRWSQKGSSQ